MEKRKPRTYDDFNKIINYGLKKYGVPSYLKDDIRQEVYLKCWNAVRSDEKEMLALPNTYILKVCWSVQTDHLRKANAPQADALDHKHTSFAEMESDDEDQTSFDVADISGPTESELRFQLEEIRPN